MRSTPDNTPLFGRFSREECGLPPAGPDPFGERLGVLRPLMLAVVLGLLGWLGGRSLAGYREVWLAGLPAALESESPETRAVLLERGVMYAAALPERPSSSRGLAMGALAAAEISPRRSGYYGNVREILAGRGDEVMRAEKPLERFIATMTLVGLLGELDEYPAAFANLEDAEQALSLLEDDELARSLRLSLANARAWLLATAPVSEGGDPARALELANLMIVSKDRLTDGKYPSESPELLDTLAMARFVNGRPGEAVDAQSLALGLTGSRGLDVYLRHFDMFSKGKENVQ